MDGLRPGSGKHLPYHVLLEALKEPGCAICRLASAAARSSLESLAGESITDPAARERWRTSFGLCAAHAGQFEAEMPRLTVAILYEDLVRRMQEELDGRARGRRQAPCPACTGAEEAEAGFVRTLADSLREAELREAYASSDGLCRSHTRLLLHRLPRDLRTWAASVEGERLRRLEAELAEVRRKHDYRYTGEAWGEERTAPGRAARKIAGEP